jgi:hypothetical protein
MEPCNLTEGPHVLAANSITLVKPVISDYPLRDDRHTNCTMNIRFVFIEMILINTLGGVVVQVWSRLWKPVEARRSP